ATSTSELGTRFGACIVSCPSPDSRDPFPTRRPAREPGLFSALDCASETSLRQHLVHELDADRALAHGGGHAFEASRPPVPDGEDAGPVRLEEEGRAAERPRRCSTGWRRRTLEQPPMRRFEDREAAHNHPFFSARRAASIRFRQPSFWIATETWFRT